MFVYAVTKDNKLVNTPQNRRALTSGNGRWNRRAVPNLTECTTTPFIGVHLVDKQGDLAASFRFGVSHDQPSAGVPPTSLDSYMFVELDDDKSRALSMNVYRTMCGTAPQYKAKDSSNADVEDVPDGFVELFANHIRRLIPGHDGASNNELRRHMLRHFQLVTSFGVMWTDAQGNEQFSLLPDLVSKRKFFKPPNYDAIRATKPIGPGEDFSAVLVAFPPLKQVEQVKRGKRRARTNDGKSSKRKKNDHCFDPNTTSSSLFDMLPQPVDLSGCFDEDLIFASLSELSSDDALSFSPAQADEQQTLFEKNPLAASDENAGWVDLYSDEREQIFGSSDPKTTSSSAIEGELTPLFSDKDVAHVRHIEALLAQINPIATARQPLTPVSHALPSVEDWAHRVNSNGAAFIGTIEQAVDVFLGGESNDDGHETMNDDGGHGHDCLLKPTSPLCNAW
jgi:hypothetical protein